MMPIRVPNRSVVPEDFRGRGGVCQNTHCLAPIEPPCQVVQLTFPGGGLTTVLCSRCMPRPCEGRFPGLKFQVIPADPVLRRPDAPPDPDSVLCIRRLSDIQPRPVPPPDPNLPGIRTRTGPLSFSELAGMDPRLLDLLAEARAHHDNPERRFCANAVWYGYPGYRPGLKSRLTRLVGHLAQGGGALRTSEAYDVAYHTIYQALPDCRGHEICG